ncbi:MAG: single-stranded DNA-binding protein [bacterium]|nr:single-stranded DNA-binding protein [bacterium]
MYLNKALIYGNLTRDPELKSLPSGTKVATFGMATNRRYKDQNGNWQDQADFHNVVVFGRQAETSAQYLKKGSGAFVEGRMQTRSWDDKQTGQKKYRTEVVAERVQFGPIGQNRTQGGPSNNNAQNNPEKGATEKGAEDSIQYPEEDINAEDIPF